jgi:hypothetical protein
MKIFSLESRTGLLGWSIVMGLAVGILAVFLTLRTTNDDIHGTIKYAERWGGFPFTMLIQRKPVCDIIDGCGEFQNSSWQYVGEAHVLQIKYLFFWILISFIILFTIRHFRKKIIQ